MILSHKHKFIYFCNGRTGSTSIEQALGGLQEGAQYDFGIDGLFVAKHIPPVLLRACLTEEVWNEYYKFVFVRNPWDWIVSNWLYNMQPRRKNRAGGVDRLLGKFKVGAEKNHKHAHKAAENLKLTAADVDRLYSALQRHKGLPNRQVCLQSTWVFDLEGRKLVDEIGRFETLTQDFARIQNRLGLNFDLPHRNGTQHSDYQLYYTAGAIERVRELWGWDVENFGYSFGA